MFWNPFKKTKAPYEEPVKTPSSVWRFEPQPNITVLELIQVLRGWNTAGGTSLPQDGQLWECPDSYIPDGVRRHMKLVRPV